MNDLIKILAIGLLASTTCIGQGDLTDKLKQPIPDLPRADLTSVKMSQDTIANLIQIINSTPPNDFRGIVVIKDNKLVVEEYFNTYWRETIHDIRSAGKGVTSLLLGIAIDIGLVKSTSKVFMIFFPALSLFVLTKTDTRILRSNTCLLCLPDSAQTTMMRILQAVLELADNDNWVNFAISLPMIFTPGQKYVYNDVCPMLVGAIIEEASGKKLSDFAKENLFTPLGIREYYWYTASNGRTGPMGNLYISTLDFAKLGQLIINKGQWQGKKIISSTWINEISKKRFDISKDDPFANSYGYFWFAATKEVNGKKYDCFYASGNGGNLLFVVPSENLVVSLISSAYGQGYGHRRSRNIFEYVLKSLNKN